MDDEEMLKNEFERKIRVFQKKRGEKKSPAQTAIQSCIYILNSRSSFVVVRLYMLRVAAFLNWLVWQFMLAAHIIWFHVAAAFGCSFGVGSRV
ncbi:unnamed protein product [Lathyrus oleraceus]